MRWEVCSRVLLFLAALPMAASADVDSRSQRFITSVLEVANGQQGADRRAELLVRVAGIQSLAGDSEAARQTVAGIEDAQLHLQGVAAIATGHALRGDLDTALALARNPERPDFHVFVLVRIAEALASAYDTKGAEKIFDEARQVVRDLPPEHARVGVRLLLGMAHSEAELGHRMGEADTLALAERLAHVSGDESQQSAVAEARQDMRARYPTANGENVAAWLELSLNPDMAKAHAARWPVGVQRMEFFCEMAVARAKDGSERVAMHDHIAAAFGAAGDESDPYNRAYGYLKLAATMGGINAILRKAGKGGRVSRIDVAMNEAEMSAWEVTDPYFRALALADVARAYLVLGDEVRS